MIDLYRPEDGDILKILPILKKDRTFCPFIKTGFVYLDGGKFIYDQSNYLKRVWHNERYVKKSNKTSNFGERFWFFVLVNGQYKFMQTGKKLTDIIKQGLCHDQTLGSLLTNDKHLKITKTQIQSFPSFDESKIVEKKWNSPNLSTNKEAVEWTIKNQLFFIEDYLENNGIFANLKLLNEYYDNAFSDLIAEDRNKKLETIGI
jgi:hypothetical protein